MAETTADVRRDIELTRERMSDTLSELEQKVNVLQVVREHPWPAIALAAGAGFVLARSKADVKAGAATLAATGGASNKVAQVLDDLAARVINEVSAAASERVDAWADELKDAIGAAGTSYRSSTRGSRKTKSERVVRRSAVPPDSRTGETGESGGDGAVRLRESGARSEGLH